MRILYTVEWPDGEALDIEGELSRLQRENAELRGQIQRLEAAMLWAEQRLCMTFDDYQEWRRIKQALAGAKPLSEAEAHKAVE